MTRGQGVTQLVTIGASAGGVETLSTLVATLPAAFPAPIVVAQHLDPTRASHLQEILARRCLLPVRTVTERAPLEAGVLYVVPANKHISISDHHLSIEEEDLGRPKPSIDLLFRTAAQVFGEGLIAVVLSGLGSDGAAGARRVKEAGGTVVIQNPRTAPFPAMPQALAPSMVDVIADADAMGPLLYDLLTGAYIPAGPQDDRQLRAFLAEVRDSSGVDFSRYKMPTIRRRLQRRLVATGTRTLEEYRAYVKGQPTEYDRMITSFLIKVTEFFRDADLFAYLRDTLLPELIAHGRAQGRELRLWSAGCATGEEAYSLALLVAEALGDELEQWTVRIFATDLDGDAVVFARRGVYPAGALEETPPALRERYFTEEAGTYTVTKRVRGLLVFGEHDLGQRPPFPRIDLCLCRNVLIYFTTELQERALETFAFALRDGGILVLGKAETANLLPASFAPVEGALRVYRRQGASPRLSSLAEQPTLGRRTRPGGVVRRAVAQDGQARLERGQAQGSHIGADRVLLSLPVGVVVVDRRYDLQHINSAARRLLGIHGEALGLDLVHLVQGVPSGDLRVAIDAAFQGEPRTLDAVSTTLVAPGETRYLRIVCQAHPTEGATAAETVVLMITDTTPTVRAGQELEAALAWARAESAHRQEVVDQVSSRNQELLAANELLTTINALLHTSADDSLLGNEEIQAATEEVETLNEELQATNEELETLNEEQQATLEELETTNEELRTRNTEAQELAAAVEAQRQRLDTILSSMAEAVLVVDGTGQTVYANPAFAQIVQAAGGVFVPQDDLGQPLPPEQTPRRRALRGETFWMEFTLVADGQRRWYEATGRPITDDACQQGAVLVMRDISDRTLRQLHDAFLALASHELRTPLTVVQGFLDLLMKGLRSQRDPALLLHHAQHAQSGTYRLQRLVDDLLDVGRLQSGKLSLIHAPLDLGEVVAGAVEAALALAGDYPVRLDAVPGPLPIVGDAQRLEQVLLNLLTNARVYAPGASVDVRVRRREGQVEVEVQDYGPGITSEALPHLFTRFYQVAASAQGAGGGLGLGLYIAREIVEGHGGTIDVSSTAGQGATFRILLPLAEDAAEPEPAPDERGQGAPRSART